jgi:hypothetical protein
MIVMLLFFLFFLTEQEGFPPTGILFDIRKRSMYTGKRKTTRKLEKIRNKLQP